MQIFSGQSNVSAHTFFLRPLVVKINDWNSLPVDLVEVADADIFRTGLQSLGPYSVIISFSSSLSNYYDAGGRVLPLCHYFIILTH